MLEITTYTSPDFGAIRTTLSEARAPLFCGTDVAQALGYENPIRDVQRHCRYGTKRYTLTNGGEQQMVFIPESDVYRLIMNSTLPTAKKFEKWVMEEVLPAIREYGVYMTPEVSKEVSEDNDVAFRRLEILFKREHEKNKGLTAYIEQLTAKNEALENENEKLTEQIEKSSPKVTFADAVAASDSPMLVGELAKILKQNGVETGAKRLFAWMRNNGFLVRRRSIDYNTPTQKSMNLGLFKVKEKVTDKTDGRVIISRTTQVTGKGQQYFVNKFLKVQQAKRKEQA